MAWIAELCPRCGGVLDVEGPHAKCPFCGMKFYDPDRVKPPEPPKGTFDWLVRASNHEFGVSSATFLDAQEIIAHQGCGAIVIPDGTDA